MAGMAWDWTAGDLFLTLIVIHVGDAMVKVVRRTDVFSKIIQPWKVAGKDAVCCYLDYLGCITSSNYQTVVFSFLMSIFCCHRGRIELFVGKGLDFGLFLGKTFTSWHGTGLADGWSIPKDRSRRV